MDTVINETSGVTNVESSSNISDLIGTVNLGYSREKALEIDNKLDAANTKYSRVYHEVKDEILAKRKESRVVGPRAGMMAKRMQVILANKDLEFANFERAYASAPEEESGFELGELTDIGRKTSSFAQEIESLTKAKSELEYKKPDSVDYEDVIVEMQEHPNAAITARPEQISVLKNNDRRFTTDVSLGESPKGEEELLAGVWFHSTNHLGRMLENGGLSTQSWLKKHDPDYYDRTLVEGSRSTGENWSPLQSSDKNLMFFSNNAVHDYGRYIVGFKPVDVVGSGLYFRFGDKNGKGDEEGFTLFPKEITVSDVCDSDSNQFPKTDAISELQIPLDNAVIGVPRGEYKQKCREFLLAGYSPEWVNEHVFSYRAGDWVKNPDQQGSAGIRQGKLDAAEEIKRRFSKKSEVGNKLRVFTVVSPVQAVEPIYTVR